MNVEDHKWFDPVCSASGCQSLLLEHALKKLMFLSMTTGGTAGPDKPLQEAIEEAAKLIEKSAAASPSRETVIEQELFDLEQSIVECRTLTDFVTVQKTVLATRTAQSWEI